jgi:hypothetical protein
MPIAMPATNPPHVSARSQPVPATAETMSACAAMAAARPVVSLSGRRAVNQKRGDVTATTVDHQPMVAGWRPTGSV